MARKASIWVRFTIVFKAIASSITQALIGDFVYSGDGKAREAILGIFFANFAELIARITS